MQFEDITPTFREAFAVHQAFRKLGFTPDQLFISLAQGKLLVILSHLEKKFTVVCGDLSMTLEELHVHWPAFIEAVNRREVSEDVLDKMWRDSYVHQEQTHLVWSLFVKGIVSPKRMS